MFVDMFGKTRLKLALYVHTARSDGEKAPEELADIFCREGYDAIAVTDPWIFNGESEINGLKILSGCEYDLGAGTAESPCLRVVGLCMTSDPAVPEDWRHLTRTAAQKAAEAVRMIRQRNGIAVLVQAQSDLALPDQSLAAFEPDTLEVYDSVSDRGAFGVAYPPSLADMLAVAKASSLLLSADLAASGESERAGAVMVEASDFDSQSIARAIRAGRFYATQGPEIHIKRVSEETVKVFCSPAEKISFRSDLQRDGQKLCGHGLVEAEYRTAPEESFVCAEVVDADGLKAFSNIIILK